MRTLDVRQRDTLRALEKRLDQLALLPAVVGRLAALDRDDPGFASAVMDLTAADPPLALRLMRLANSVEAAASTPLETIPAAISRVGARALAEVVTAFSVVEVFVPHTKGQRNLWIHAIQVATTARMIAQLTPHLHVEPEHAYLAGLLHDIGRFVMFEHAPTELGRVDETGFTTPQALLTAELEICGFDHAELGWLACRQWALPERVSALIKNHHVYERLDATRLPPEVVPLVRIVQQADFLSFLLLDVPDLARRGAAERQAMIARRCVHPRWDQPPAAPSLLAEHVLRIDQQSRRTAAVVQIVFDE